MNVTKKFIIKEIASELLNYRNEPNEELKKEYKEILSDKYGVVLIKNISSKIVMLKTKQETFLFEYSYKTAKYVLKGVRSNVIS